MNISNWIDRWAARDPQRTAIRFNGVDLSYAAMALQIGRLAAVLHNELGVRTGDRVAYLGLNRVEAFLLVFACARLGAIYLPINWRLSPTEWDYILGNAVPKVLVAEQAFCDAVMSPGDKLPTLQRLTLGGARPGWLAFSSLMNAAETRLAADAAAGDDAPLLLCYTSGTTGRTKGAVLTQKAIFFNAINSSHMHDLTSHDRILVTLPLFHVGGLNIQALPGLHAGATIILQAAYDAAAALKAIAVERITLTVLVPTQLKAMLALPQWPSADLSSLRMITTGSVIVPRALIRAVHDRKIPLIQVYGSTETAPIAAYLRADEAERGIGSGGKCAIHCEMAIIDEAGQHLPAGQPGEILVRGPNVMIEYWQDGDMTAASLKNGWFHTGDIGHFDDEGFLYVDDRKKDMIISGGENIYPAVLEQILAECPDIAEAAVVGRPDERWEEVAVAVVVLRQGAKLSAADILALLEGRVARFALPKAVIFVEGLPHNAMGKVVKSDLRAMVAARLDA